MTQPYLGEIKMVGFSFAPRGYMTCSGQLIAIAQNSALFALLGTNYGGDGVTTFGLPDMRGRMPMGQGNGPGLTPRTLGEKSGSETAQLNINNMPQHNHSLFAMSGGGNTATPTSGAFVAASTARDNIYSTTGAIDTPLAANSIGLAGGNQPFTIMNPYAAVTFVIASEGIFPSRN